MNSIPENLLPWLSQLILVNAVKEDVVGPTCDHEHLNPIEYVRRCIPTSGRRLKTASVEAN